MKIVIINVTANSGSTGKIAFGQYTNLVRDHHTVMLYYGRNDSIQTDTIIRFTSKFGVLRHGLLGCLTGLHGYYSKAETRQLIRRIDKFQPDLVQLYNLHGYYMDINMLLNYLKEKHVPTVYSMLDEFPYLGRCCYSYDCNQFQTGCLHCTAKRNEYPYTFFFRRSHKFFYDKMKAYAYDEICFTGPQWVLNRAKTSPLLSDERLYCVDEYVDTDHVFYPRKAFKKLAQDIISLDKIIILTVAPYSNPRKGGSFFLELAHLLESEERFQFIYIGMDVRHVSLPSNCKAVGFVKDQNELAEYYSIADLFVCTSTADTMPNVCLDSLACGTPILGFDISGIPFVAEEPLGHFVTPFDIHLMADYVRKTGKKDSRLIQKCRDYAVKRYSPSVYYKKMLDIYRDMANMSITG